MTAPAPSPFEMPGVFQDVVFARPSGRLIVNATVSVTPPSYEVSFSAGLLVVRGAPGRDVCVVTLTPDGDPPFAFPVTVPPDPDELGALLMSVRNPGVAPSGRASNKRPGLTAAVTLATNDDATFIVPVGGITQVLPTFVVGNVFTISSDGTSTGTLSVTLPASSTVSNAVLESFATSTSGPLTLNPGDSIDLEVTSSTAAKIL